MTKALVDTSFAVALMDSKDHHYSRAVGMLERIEEEKLELIYADCVLNEIYSVIARRLVERKMSTIFPEVADEITSSLESVVILNTYRYLPKAHREVVDLMKQTQGRLNYHDALIALSLREEGIDRIVSLDRDFDKVGWLERVG
jgi:predicted nucleic acid-binding protein